MDQDEAEDMNMRGAHIHNVFFLKSLLIYVREKERKSMSRMEEQRERKKPTPR